MLPTCRLIKSKETYILETPNGQNFLFQEFMKQNFKLVAIYLTTKYNIVNIVLLGVDMQKCEFKLDPKNRTQQLVEKVKITNDSL